MKLPTLSLVLCLALAGCGDGNPFEDNANPDPDPGTETPGDTPIPEELAGNLEGFQYNAKKQTLTIRGVDLEDSPYEAKYRRRPGLDRNGYQAYTQQDGSLDRHSTAYVKDIRGTKGVIVMTGGQFEEVFAGSSYSNKSYSAPVPQGANRERGLISYVGRYVGLLNGPGSDEDLMPVKNGTPEDFKPVQAAEVTGRVLLTGSFSDRSVDGVITRRKITDTGEKVGRLALTKGDIANDGTFNGTLTQNLEAKGTYGGIFGGEGASEVAGVVKAQDHLENYDKEFEHGMFVLGACGRKGQDRLCKQPRP